MIDTLINQCATLLHCDNCNCPQVNYDCIYSCTYTKLKFKYPEDTNANTFNNIFFAIADSGENDSVPLFYADSTNNADTFDLTQPDIGYILLNDENPCEFCVEGGIYWYEITGDILVSPPDNYHTVMIARGELCIKTSIRSLINPCE